MGDSYVHVLSAVCTKKRSENLYLRFLYGVFAFDILTMGTLMKSGAGVPSSSVVKWLVSRDLSGTLKMPWQCFVFSLNASNLLADEVALLGLITSIFV